MMSQKILKISEIFLSLLLINTALAVEVIKPDSEGVWKVGPIGITTTRNCHLTSNFFPDINCGIDEILILRNPDGAGETPYFKLQMGEIVLGEGFAFYPDFWPKEEYTQFSNYPNPVYSEELYHAIKNNKNAIINLKTRLSKSSPIIEKEIRLYDFENAKKTRESLVMHNLEIRKWEVLNFNIRELLEKALLAALILAIFFFTAKAILKRKKKNIEGKTTPKIIKQTDEASIETLKNQIKAALDAGDSKTAGNLLKVLDTIQNSDTKS